LNGLIDEGQKGALRREGGEKLPRRIPRPDEYREHDEEDSK
jgi:hypothetical protein